MWKLIENQGSVARLKEGHVIAITNGYLRLFIPMARLG
jgi:hypothetical protein